MKGAWGTRIGTSGRHALMRTGQISMGLARKHPYAVGGTALGIGGYTAARWNGNRAYNNVMRTNGPGSNNPGW